MKLVADDIAVEKNFISEQNAFTIEASAKAFDILSNGIYSNKIKAIVRELSTNAYDAHVENGNEDQPFDVCLPTKLRDVFQIRDYGPGLSHEDCMNLYTTYFASTKTNSNDVVGCLGLGSKSPFAYTDSFVVTSYHGGKKRIYNAHKDNSGPSFILIEEVDSDEPTGLSIEILVDRYDFSKFYNEAKKVYKYFKVKPNISGEHIKFKEEKITFESDNWSIVEGGDHEIVMGQVAYPIFIDQLSDCDEVYNFLTRISGLRLEVPIGTVDISTSREALSYNEATKEKLYELIIDLSSNIEKEIEKQIQACDTLYEARKLCVENAHNDIFDNYAKDIQWHGQDIFDFRVGKAINVDENLEIEHFYKKGYNKRPTKQGFSGEIAFGRNKNYKVLFFYKDTKEKPMARVYEYLEQHHNYDYVTIYIYAGEDLPKFLKSLGDCPESDIIFISELDIPKYNTNTGGGIPCQEFDPSLRSFVTSKMSVKYKDAIYLVESRGFYYLIEGSGKKFTLNQVKKVLCCLLDNGCDLGGTIYTVKPGMVKGKDLENRKNWKSAPSVIKKSALKLFDKNIESIYYTKHYFRWSDFADIKEIFQKTNNDTIKSLIREYEECLTIVDKSQEEVSKINNLDTLIDVVDMNSILSKYKPKYSLKYFTDRYQASTEKYESLHYIYDTDDAVRYINQIDELYKLRNQQK